jgi:DNA-binding CsgD family transcriptional regulator
MGIHLTALEKRVLILYKKGLTYEQIANELGVSWPTVNYRVKKLHRYALIPYRLVSN